MFKSTYRRGGEPVIVAFGAVLDGTAPSLSSRARLRCGLLFVRERLEQASYTLSDDTGSRFDVRLPQGYLHQSADTHYTNAILEVA